MVDFRQVASAAAAEITVLPPACFAIRAVFVAAQHKIAFGQKAQPQCILDVPQGL
jgi:hypothetical protein